MANEPLRMERFFAEFRASTPVAIEASGTWWWLVDLLEGLGHRPVLSHPKQTKAIAAARLKNDALSPVPSTIREDSLAVLHLLDEQIRRLDSKEGNRLVRWALVVVATQAARQPGPLRAWFRVVQQRKGKKVARVALARRLAEIVYPVWRDDIDDFEVLRRGGVRG